MRSIFVMPLVDRCLETIDVCIWHMFIFYVYCSECLGGCGNGGCVALLKIVFFLALEC